MAEIEFEGQKFGIKTGPLNELVMTEFFAATVDMDGATQIPNDVMLALLEESIATVDYKRFMRLGRRTDNFWEKALVVLETRMKAVADHPTGLPSDSTDGPVDTDLKSDPSYDAKVWELAGGQPDKYQMLMAHKKHRGLQAVA